MFFLTCSKFKEESSTSSYSYHTTLAESFKMTYWAVERSLKDSTSNEGTFYSRNGKEEEVSSIFEQMRGWETSTSEENMKEYSSDKEHEVCLKATYDVNTFSSSKPSYEQLFRMSGQFVEENDKLRERFLGLKRACKIPWRNQ